MREKKKKYPREAGWVQAEERYGIRYIYSNTVGAALPAGPALRQGTAPQDMCATMFLQVPSLGIKFQSPEQ